MTVRRPLGKRRGRFGAIRVSVNDVTQEASLASALARVAARAMPAHAEFTSASSFSRNGLAPALSIFFFSPFVT